MKKSKYSELLGQEIIMKFKDGDQIKTAIGKLTGESNGFVTVKGGRGTIIINTRNITYIKKI